MFWHHCRNPGSFTALSKQIQPSSELPVSRDRKIGVNLVKSLVQSVKRGEPGVKEEDVSAQLWGHFTGWCFRAPVRSKRQTRKIWD